MYLQTTIIILDSNINLNSSISIEEQGKTTQKIRYETENKFIKKVNYREMFSDQ